MWTDNIYEIYDLIWIWDFKSFFKEKIFSIQNLKSSFENFSIPEKTKKSKIILDDKKIKSTIQNMNIAYINYQFLKDFFQNILNEKISFSQKKLIEWVINELLARQLVK